ncbi:MAG: PilZ domain-containing protein [SAR324 cluster bacterium]|nr:PilZ domain-containing protein [SAR324 cluster bacterium]
MANDKLEETYEQLLEHSRLTGEAEERQSARERRRHLRVQVDSADLQVDSDPWVFLINLSSSGIAFHSDTPYRIEQTVQISLEGITVEATVVDIQQETGEETAGVGVYRVSCTFADETAGKRLLLEIKNWENSHLEGTI